MNLVQTAHGKPRLEWARPVWVKAAACRALAALVSVAAICLGLTTHLAAEDSFRIGVIGLTHTHVHWIFESEKRGGFTVAGIVEPNTDLAQRYADQHGFSMEKVYPTMDALFEHEDLDAVTAFGSIYEHLGVVQAAAPRGVHVMVEKPLAVSMGHARIMYDLAKDNHIHLLTNYETSWYPSNHRARAALKDGTVGEVRKVIVRDGHKGPRKLGINDEFLDWLTDPVQNGGGALMDFGCYGANLMTWLMDGQRPKTVTAITDQFQPDNNPQVEDESLIILGYERAQAVVQGSWNWPIGRKDMEIYGTGGVLYSDNRHQFRVRIAKGYDGYDERTEQLPERAAPYHDPFLYFKAVVRGEIEVKPTDLSALENNMTVMEILDAARESARSGRTVSLP